MELHTYFVFRQEIFCMCDQHFFVWRKIFLCNKKYFEVTKNILYVWQKIFWCVTRNILLCDEKYFGVKKIFWCNKKYFVCVTKNILMCDKKYFVVWQKIFRGLLLKYFDVWQEIFCCLTKNILVWQTSFSKAGKFKKFRSYRWRWFAGVQEAVLIRNLNVESFPSVQFPVVDFFHNFTRAPLMTRFQAMGCTADLFDCFSPLCHA
jgi:hypothetical protein